MDVGELIRRQEKQCRLWRNNAQLVWRGNICDAYVYEGNVTGLSHHQYKAVADELNAGKYLEVRPDPTNKYDSNATGLWFKGKQIGWIPKALNGPASQAWKNDLQLKATITKHVRNHSDMQQMLFVSVVASKTLKLSNEVPTQPIKETIMTKTTVNSIVEKNISLGTSAAFLEAGRIANNQLSSIAGKKLPIMVRAYVDTALGRLLLANVALMARDHFRPEDERLGKLVNAMAVSAYQEVLQTFDVEAMIDELISNKTITKALKTIDSAETAA